MDKYDTIPFIGLIDMDAPGYARAVRAPLPPNASGPHDGNFTADGSRLDVSAINVTYVLDTSDPMDPKVRATIADPAISIHHEPWRTPDGRYMVITEETHGAAGIPNCPGGAVHVFDLGPDGEAEASPISVGAFVATHVTPYADRPSAPSAYTAPVCSAAEGGFSADGTRLSMGCFRGGVRVFDTSALMSGAPLGTPVGALVTEVGHWTHTVERGQSWVARFVPGNEDYVVSNDFYRGLEVYRLSGDAAP